MESRIDDQIATISQRIRRWREEKGLTREELGSRSGLATSTVHKVETGQMIPSVAVLLKLAHGLGRRPTEMIQDADADTVVAVVRAGEREEVSLRERMTVERISGDVLDPTLEMWRVTLHPGMSSGHRPIQYDGEALIVCEKGRLTVRVGDEEHVLANGDAIHYKASIPHFWRNDGRAVARFTITGTLPRELRSLIHRRVAHAAESRPGK
jgi:transcriptional regulator with XRE-family HTH domain